MRWSRMAVHSHRNRMSRDDLYEDEKHVGYCNGFAKFQIYFELPSFTAIIQFVYTYFLFLKIKCVECE